jgi:hypothetical protein
MRIQQGCPLVDRSISAVFISIAIIRIEFFGIAVKITVIAHRGPQSLFLPKFSKILRACENCVVSEDKFQLTS